MSVTVRPYRGKRDVFEVDIAFKWQDGSSFRRRFRAPVKTEAQAQRWGEAKEREFFARGKPVPKTEEKEVPTFSAFAPRYLAHGRAEQQKASTLDSKGYILTHHLVPLLGSKRLDALQVEDVAKVKEALTAKTHTTKTINNVLAVLSGALNVAIEWGIITTRPRIKRLKVTQPEAPFLDFDERERLLEAAKKIDARVHLAVLLGADAGLRRGEILALKWTDIDLRRKRQLTVSRSVWKATEDTPKGGRSRHVPLTHELAAVLTAHRHMRGAYVLCHEDGRRIECATIQGWMGQATKRAGLPVSCSLHILRHTFCSHLAMRGAPVKAIQELAGHASLNQTLRYMHLSVGATDAAIRLLDTQGSGEGLEKPSSATA